MLTLERIDPDMYWFYVVRDGQRIGCLCLLPVSRPHGWPGGWKASDMAGETIGWSKTRHEAMRLVESHAGQPGNWPRAA